MKKCNRFLSGLLSISTLLTALLSCLFLSACGRGGGKDKASLSTDYSLEQMAASVLNSQSGLPSLYAVTSGEEVFFSYLPLYFGDQAALAEEGILCIPAGASASEICIFRLKDSADTERAETLLRAYAENRAAVFTGYAPEEAALAGNAVTVLKGQYAALFICKDAVKARDAFLSCFGSPAPVGLTLQLPSLPGKEDSGDASELPSSDFSSGSLPSPEDNADDAYDHEGILNAWKSGEDGGLSRRNAQVLTLCKEILDEITREDMTPYEKELAVHDWMITHGNYDEAVLNPLAGLTPVKDNDNPLGFLLERKGICLGYTTTFQLFMDLLGIECITVRGYAKQTEDHAWNMVKLDGDWYCVDVTWDDPVGAGENPHPLLTHRYFNVTSEFLRQTDHQWKEDKIPVAVGQKYAWTWESNDRISG